MTRTPNPNPARDTVTYQQHLKNALKLFHQPEELGAESPLASPYFLGSALAAVTPEALAPRHRGERLQAELLAAAAALLLETPPRNRLEMEQLLNRVRHDPDHHGYSYLVLELRCFQRFFKVPKTADIWEREDLLPGSRAEHYRDFDRAVELLGETLLDRLRPNIRLEPIARSARQIGYEADYQRALGALTAHKTVTLCGAGGMGKSTLGANLAAAAHFTAVFWYTLRAGFNDNLQSLLFALAHFLHQQGASALWRQLAVGQLHERHLILGLLQKDLQTLNQQPLLLCFDEMEILHGERAGDAAAAQELLEFLRTLHGHFAMLYMSQVPLLESDLYCELRGLSTAEFAALLHNVGRQVAPSEVQALHAYTHGNPRMLQLALLALESGRPDGAPAQSLPQTPALQPIWQRIRQRLTAADLQILHQLAVFRKAAPQDHWQDERHVVDRLLAHGLVQTNGYGGIELLPVLRDLLYGQIDQNSRNTLHLNAATICAERGDYTEAAHHYTQGDRPSLAVQIWYPHHTHEVLRGQGGAALNIFAQIQFAELPKAEQKALTLILAELHRRHGNPQQGLDVLDKTYSGTYSGTNAATDTVTDTATDWATIDEADVLAHNLRGQFLEALGRIDEAEASYGIGIQNLMRLQQNLVHLQCQRGLLHTRRRNTQQMRQHLLQARWEVQRLQGMIEEFEGRFQEAYISYQSALAIAQSTGNHADLAIIQFALARILARLGRYKEALTAAQDALTHCEASSDWFTRAQIYTNLAAIHKDAGNLDAALDAGRQAISQFRLMGAPHWIALTAINLAEAYADRAEWSNAERYAQEAIDQQAPHSYPYGLFTLGRVRHAEALFEEAKELFQRSLHAAQENGDRFMEAYAQRAIGELDMTMGRKAEGGRRLEQALSLFEHVGMQDEIATTNQLLAQAHSSMAMATMS